MCMCRFVLTSLSSVREISSGGPDANRRPPRRTKQDSNWLHPLCDRQSSPCLTAVFSSTWHICCVDLSSIYSSFIPNAIPHTHHVSTLRSIAAQRLQKECLFTHSSGEIRITSATNTLAERKSQGQETCKCLFDAFKAISAHAWRK